MLDGAMDTRSEITTKGLKKKEVVQVLENKRDTPANGNTNENGEQKADNEAEEEEEGGKEEEEKEEKEDDAEEEEGNVNEAEVATSNGAAE
ncbi:prothymosin alpha-like [Saccopteryx leptura]|uniref:prothymosin alpha-like n=1 Tax=Saccopteryx leptura TaxID=249018 RepID=UPI00339C7BE8